MITDLQKRLEEKQLTVELTQAAKDYVVDSGYDPVYGARPLRRFLQSRVENRYRQDHHFQRPPSPHPPGGGLRRQGADRGAGDHYACGEVSSQKISRPEKIQGAERNSGPAAICRGAAVSSSGRFPRGASRKNEARPLPESG